MYGHHLPIEFQALCRLSSIALRHQLVAVRYARHRCIPKRFETNTYCHHLGDISVELLLGDSWKVSVMLWNGREIDGVDLVLLVRDIDLVLSLSGITGPWARPVIHRSILFASLLVHKYIIWK